MLSQVLQPFQVVSAAVELVADQIKGSVKMRYQCRAKMYPFLKMKWDGLAFYSLVYNTK